MSKLDLTRAHKELYTAKAAPALVFAPAAHYIAITGQGDPNGDGFAYSTQALYTAAFSVKNAYKQEQDFSVSKLEGLWWIEHDEWMSNYTDALHTPREQWHWELMIRMPDFVTSNGVKKAVSEAFEKKQLPLLRQVALSSLAEGKSVQALHIGPYATEPATLERMHEFMKANGLQRNGRHHEIYLSDPRKTAPDKLKTILRQPVK